MISKPVGNKARCSPASLLLPRAWQSGAEGHPKGKKQPGVCAGRGTKASPPHKVSGSLTPPSSLLALISVCVKKGIALRAVPSDQLLEKMHHSSWDMDCFHKQDRCFSSCNEMWGCLPSLSSPGCGGPLGESGRQDTRAPAGQNGGGNCIQIQYLHVSNMDRVTLWVLCYAPCMEAPSCMLSWSLGLCFPSGCLQTHLKWPNSQEGALSPPTQPQGACELSSGASGCSGKWDRQKDISSSSPFSLSSSEEALCTLSVATLLISTCKERLTAKTRCTECLYSVYSDSLSGRLFLFLNMNNFGKPAPYVPLSFPAFLFFFYKEIFLHLWFSLLCCMLEQHPSSVPRVAGLCALV